MKNIMVCTLSRSLGMICEDNIKLAKTNLEQMGYNVEFSKNSNCTDSFISTSIKKRIIS